MTALNLIPGQLSLAQLRDVYQQPVKVTLDNSASAQIEASVACVEQILADLAPTLAQADDSAAPARSVLEAAGSAGPGGAEAGPGRSAGRRPEAHRPRRPGVAAASARSSPGPPAPMRWVHPASCRPRPSA